LINKIKVICRWYSIWAFPFLKKLRERPFRKTAEAKDFRGIYPEPAEGIPNAASKLANILPLLQGLKKIAGELCLLQTSFK